MIAGRQSQAEPAAGPVRGHLLLPGQVPSSGGGQGPGAVQGVLRVLRREPQDHRHQRILRVLRAIPGHVEAERGGFTINEAPFPRKAVFSRAQVISFRS